MPIVRKDIVQAGTEGVFHCIVRCVRRAFLCGLDPYSGKSYEHRRQWIMDRAELLAACFCIDVATLSVMNNHFHITIRTRPDRAETLSDEHVAVQWLRSLAQRYDENGLQLEPDKMEVLRTVENKERITVLRERLSDISWFMSSLNENIARRANAEDNVTLRP